MFPPSVALSLGSCDTYQQGQFCLLKKCGKRGKRRASLARRSFKA